MNAPESKPASLSPSPERIQAHWSELCTRIGERRAGSAGEQAAAEYLLARFREAGLQALRAESFPCVCVASAEAEVALGDGSALQSLPARVLAGSPGTPGAQPVEGDLEWIEMPEQARRLLQPSLEGKVVVLFGPMPTRADLHRKLVQCRPAAVIHVDDRLPFDWVKDDGVYPAWVKSYGMPPTVTIAYRAAWEARKSGARRARVRATVDLEKGASQNVVAEIPGRRPDLPVVLVGAHHDTQCHNTGADDNASAVVALLELAVLLGRSRPLRSIRLVSFGAEEQLSVGSACYVAAHRKEMESVGVVLNLDSVASPLGHHWLLRGGTAEFGSWLVRRLAKEGLDVVEKAAPMPFADHFPFSVFGVPSVTFIRPNMDNGLRWQHHSAHDQLENVSTLELSRVIKAVGALAAGLAAKPRWPFPRGLAPDQRPETARLARELFGLRA
ncbi:MAG: M28 family metallopeptidase [Limisphaerales bacterium]